MDLDMLIDQVTAVKKSKSCPPGPFTFTLGQYMIVGGIQKGVQYCASVNMLFKDALKIVESISPYSMNVKWDWWQRFDPNDYVSRFYDLSEAEKLRRITSIEE
jgi:hypothetical protein